MLSRIEAAMVSHLVEAKLPYLRTVATYAADFDDGLPTVVRQLPAVWLAFRGSAGEPRALGTTRKSWRCPVAWLVMCGARDLRQEAARRGSAGSVGVYTMLGDTARLLVGQTFGLPIDPLALGPVRVICNTRTERQALAIYSQEWRTAYTIGADEPDLPLLTTVGLRYHLLPDDGVADAEDILTLQGDNP